MQKIIQDRKYFRSTTPSPQLFNQNLVNGYLVQYLIVLLSDREIKGSVLGGKYLNVYCFLDFYQLFSDSSYYICLSFVDFLRFFYVDITINLFPYMLILIRKHLKKTLHVIYFAWMLHHCTGTCNHGVCVCVPRWRSF